MATFRVPCDHAIGNLHIGTVAGGGGDRVRKSRRQKAPSGRAAARAAAISPTRLSRRQEELRVRGTDQPAIVRLAADDDALLQQELPAAVADDTATCSRAVQHHKSKGGMHNLHAAKLSVYMDVAA